MGATNAIKRYCVYQAPAVIQFEENRRTVITLGKFTLGNLDPYQGSRKVKAQKQIRTITVSLSQGEKGHGPGKCCAGWETEYHLCCSGTHSTKIAKYIFIFYIFFIIIYSTLAK